MATPFTISGALVFPPDPGQPNAPIPFGVVSQFDDEAASAPITLLGAATQVINLPAALVGVKGLLIKLDEASPTPGSTPAPIYVRLNGGSTLGQVEISPGGFLALGSPNPIDGITAVSIVYTTDVRLRIWALS